MTGGHDCRCLCLQVYLAKCLKSCRVCGIFNDITPLLDWSSRSNYIRVILVEIRVMNLLVARTNLSSIRSKYSQSLVSSYNDWSKCSLLDTVNDSSIFPTLSNNLLILFEYTSNFFKTQDIRTLCPSIRCNSTLSSNKLTRTLFNEFTRFECI